MCESCQRFGSTFHLLRQHRRNQDRDGKRNGGNNCRNKDRPLPSPPPVPVDNLPGADADKTPLNLQPSIAKSIPTLSCVGGERFEFVAAERVATKGRREAGLGGVCPLLVSERRGVRDDSEDLFVSILGSEELDFLLHPR